MKSTIDITLFLKLISATSVATFTPLSSTFAAKHIEDRCRPIGGQSEQLCDVSIYAVVSNPAQFNGAEISLIGFYSDGYIPILFVNKSAHEVSDVSSGIFLDFSEADAMTVNLLRRNNYRYVMVIGTFINRNKPTYEIRGFATSGTIKVSRAGIAPPPWGTSEPPPTSAK